MLELMPHQQEAYESVMQAFANRDTASVVMATGCGKSFVALKLLDDNPNKRFLFLSPAQNIADQFNDYLQKYVIENDFSTNNLSTLQYAGLATLSDIQLQRLNPDYIIFDEFHRTGGMTDIQDIAIEKNLERTWASGVDRLLKLNPQAKKLALTATPLRMDGIDVLTNRFGEKPTYELSLIDALARGILKSPKYVTTIYTLKDEVDDLEKSIANENDTKRKKELENTLSQIKKQIANAPTIPNAIKNDVKLGGRYIVFCPITAKINETIENVSNWFRELGLNFQISKVLSNQTDKQNEQNVLEFKRNKGNTISLLFSKNMLNEGVHSYDVDGSIMLRPTESRIIYLQQLGRVLSSDKSKPQPVVWDFVNNWRANDIEVEIEKIRDELAKKQKERISDKEMENGYYDLIFEFQIDTSIRDFYSMLAILDDKPSFIKTMQEIADWSEIEKRRPRGKTDPVEYRLSTNLSNIRAYLQSRHDKDNLKNDYFRLKEMYSNYSETYPSSVFAENMILAHKWSVIHGRRPRRGINAVETKLASSINDVSEQALLKNMYDEYLQKYSTSIFVGQMLAIDEWSKINCKIPNATRSHSQETDYAKKLSHIKAQIATWEANENTNTMVYKQLKNAYDNYMKTYNKEQPNINI